MTTTFTVYTAIYTCVREYVCMSKCLDYISIISLQEESSSGLVRIISSEKLSYTGNCATSGYEDQLNRISSTVDEIT